MTIQQKVLYHQIHPLKLLTDGSAAVLSCYLLWRHRLRPALLVQFIPPIVASGALLRWADLEPQKRSAVGRYVGRHMTPQMQAVRFAGNLVLSWGAWARRPPAMLLGLLIVLFGWLRGLVETPHA
jgi:hypothetical protein